jgi:hypothetical protein
MTIYFFTPTFTLLNPRRAGFAVSEIQQGESSPVKGEEFRNYRTASQQMVTNGHKNGKSEKDRARNTI